MYAAVLNMQQAVTQAEDRRSKSMTAVAAISQLLLNVLKLVGHFGEL